jgi:hypothetical protein
MIIHVKLKISHYLQSRHRRQAEEEIGKSELRVKRRGLRRRRWPSTQLHLTTSKEGRNKSFGVQEEVKSENFQYTSYKAARLAVSTDALLIPFFCDRTPSPEYLF